MTLKVQSKYKNIFFHIFKRAFNLSSKKMESSRENLFPMTFNLGTYLGILINIFASIQQRKKDQNILNFPLNGKNTRKKHKILNKRMFQLKLKSKINGQSSELCNFIEFLEIKQ